MRIISILRWVCGLRALTPALTTTSQALARSGGDATRTVPAPGTLSVPAAADHVLPAARRCARLPAPFRSRPHRGPRDGDGARRARLPYGTAQAAPREPHPAPAVPAAPTVPGGTPSTAPRPAGAPLPVFLHGARPAH
ncbi:hypothetical protein San01_20840 [Streptomyces angustmyceticus]|uniref:Secreted protein n=1 Tax=Streptomyces angustmyceticus TaxID=285578 RepID=A0A5J4L5A9_9ACTN|nr:hypothetical protein San01_20840 [Streptomyces angustmyceticus]